MAPRRSDIGLAGTLASATLGIMDPALLSRFHRDGWVHIPDAVGDKVISEARHALGGFYPTYDEIERSPEAYPWASDGQFGGLRLWPVDVLPLDLLPLDEAIVTIAQSLTSSEDVRLLRAAYQIKYGGTVDYTQVLHFDYPNHSLVVPADDDIIGFFLYLSDVPADVGPTMLVSDTVRGPLLADRTHLWSINDGPEIYAAEQAATGTAGSLLAYRSTTYHRGSAMTAARGVRLTLGFAYGKPAPWTGYQSFPRLGEEAGLINAIAAATPRQRSLLGFPPPGDPYWTPGSLAGVARRYPGFDPADYI